MNPSRIKPIKVLYDSGILNEGCFLLLFMLCCLMHYGCGWLTFGLHPHDRYGHTFEYQCRALQAFLYLNTDIRSISAVGRLIAINSGSVAE